MRSTFGAPGLMVMLLLCVSGSPALAQRITRPDAFDITFERGKLIHEAIRENGNAFVTVLFRLHEEHNGIQEQRLPRKVDVTGEIGLCRARMETFQKALPEGLDTRYGRGLPHYAEVRGMFVLPSIMVGRSLQGQEIAARAGGTWAVQRTVNATGWNLFRPAPSCIYLNNDDGVPTIGPWQDGPTASSYRVFPYYDLARAEVGHAIVIADAPLQGNLALHRGLGVDPGPPRRNINPLLYVPAPGVLGYTAHLRTFFTLACNSDQPDTLFFRVDYGFDLGMTGFTNNPEETLSSMQSSVSVATNPEPYPARTNGPLIPRAEDFTNWTLTDCQAEPR